MKKTIIKFTAGFSALIIGLSIVWASGIFQSLFPTLANRSLSSSRMSAARSTVGEKSGKVLVHFKEFHYGKGWFAYFEVTNDTSEPVFYVGSKREDSNYADYCSLGVREKEQSNNFSPFKVLNECHYSQVDKLVSLESGESVVFGIYEYDIRKLLDVKDAKIETRAQFGFEFFVGKEKQREILWSEEVIFPDDEYR